VRGVVYGGCCPAKVLDWFDDGVNFFMGGGSGVTKFPVSGSEIQMEKMDWSWRSRF